MCFCDEPEYDESKPIGETEKIYIVHMIMN